MSNWRTIFLYFILLLMAMGCQTKPEKAEPDPAGELVQGKIFEWTPQPGQAGTYDVTFFATDGTEITSETITITVQEDIDFDGPSKWLTRTEGGDVIDLRYLARLTCPKEE